MDHRAPEPLTPGECDRFVLVVMVHGAATGVTFTKWREHITLVPWFRYPAGLEVLRAQLAAELEDLAPFQVKATEKTTLDKDGKIPVHKLTLEAPLRDLHATLLAAINDAGRLVEDLRFTGERFTPHITVRGDRAMQGGETVTVGAVHIVGASSKDRQRRRLMLDAVPFGGDSGRMHVTGGQA